jgi:hypothetical protein
MPVRGIRPAISLRLALSAISAISVRYLRPEQEKYDGRECTVRPQAAGARRCRGQDLSETGFFWDRICQGQSLSGAGFVRGRICLGQRHHAAALPEVADLRGDSHRHMVPVSRCFRAVFVSGWCACPASGAACFRMHALLFCTFDQQFQ